MTITEQQRNEMLEVAKPLIRWLNENCHPHCTAHVDQNTIELTEGVATSRTDEFLRFASYADAPGRCKCSDCGRVVDNAWRDSDGHHCLTCLAKQRDEAREALSPNKTDQTAGENPATKGNR